MYTTLYYIYTVLYYTHVHVYIHADTHIHILFSGISKVLDIGHNYFLKCLPYTDNKHVKTFCFLLSKYYNKCSIKLLQNDR